jgi:hypothetical protein
MVSLNLCNPELHIFLLVEFDGSESDVADSAGEWVLFTAQLDIHLFHLQHLAKEVPKLSCFDGCFDHMFIQE